MTDRPAGRTRPSAGRVLIVKPSAFGDVVHTIPAARSLAAGYPEASIDWVVDGRFAALVELAPAVDRVLRFRRRGRGRSVSFLALLRSLRRERYELVVDFQGLLRSAVMAAATRAPRRFGFVEAREGSGWGYTDRVRGGRDRHAVDRYLDLAAAAGGRAEPGDDPPMAIPGSVAADVETILREALPDTGRPMAVLHPATRWETKRWPAPSFAMVARRLGDEGINVAVVGVDADRERTGPIAAAAGRRGVDLAGVLGLPRLAALLGRASVMIGNDSGPLHLADLLGIPVVALFGASDPARTGPRGPAARVLVRPELECRPCLSRQCRYQDEIACLRLIDPDRVVSAALEVLGRRVDHSIEGT